MFSQKKVFLIFQETETLEISYTSGSNFPSSKIKKLTLKKLLLILFAEGELLKHKREKNFLFLHAAIFTCQAVLSLEYLNSSLFFFYFDWLSKAFRTNHSFFHEKQK